MTLRTLLELTGLAIGVASLAYTAYSIGIGRKTARAQFWLDLRDRFAKHDPVHRKLRPGGEWAQPDSGPKTPEDWADLEAYLGLFEHCEVMLSERLIDLSTFKAIYEYRIRNILVNHAIVQEKLVKRAAGWVRFINLVRRLGLHITDAAA